MPRLAARAGLDVVGIHGLELDCIVGIRPHERLREQRVQIEIGLGLDTRQAAKEGRIGLTVDYDHVSEQLLQMLQFRRYHLIEAAAEELTAMLLAVHPVLQELTLRIQKPGALEGRAMAASVEVFRRREDFDCLDGSEHQRLDSECVVLHTRDTKLSLISMVEAEHLTLPGQRSRAIAWPLNGCVQREQLTRRDGEKSGSEELRPGEFLAAGHQEQCILRNVGTEPVTLFVCALTEDATASTFAEAACALNPRT